MRATSLTLAMVATAALLVHQSARSDSPSNLAPIPAALGAEASPVPLDPNVHIILSPEQQRQASATGGFRQVPKSLLRIDRRMQYGDFEWNDQGVPPGRVTVRMDLRTQILSVFRAGHEIGTAVALYGADSKKTPLGTFPILWKGKNHRSSLYDAPMPFTLRLTGDGVAIHGSNVRWGAATHGCVGVPTEFARHLFAQARVGDVVTIVRTAPFVRIAPAA